MRCGHPSQPQYFPLVLRDGTTIEDALVLEADCDEDGCSGSYGLDVDKLLDAGYREPTDEEADEIIWFAADALKAEA